MADHDGERASARAMSLIPYVPEQSRQIVLRHKSTVVVYDPRSKQITLRDASGVPDAQKCPICHRPFGDSSSTEDESEAERPLDQMNPGYFNMLDQSLDGEASAARRRLQGSSSSNEPLAVPPLPGAQFVASEPRTPPVTQGISPAAFSQDYFKTFFREERELGKGGKGVVVLVTHILDGYELGKFACKRVPVGNNHSWLEKVLLEVKTLQNLSHPNLVSYRHVWLEDYQVNSFSPKVPFCFILQQFCNGGDLQKYVLSQPRKSSMTKQELKNRLRRRSKGQTERPDDLNLPRRIPFEDILAFFIDITDGLHYLHSHGFIHRDIKPSNCLLHVEDSGGVPRVLLSDFGEVQVTNTSRTGTGATGTVSYCAPEVLRQDNVSGAFGNFTVKSDIFSVGMIVFFMCFTHLPYHHSDDFNEENEDIELLRGEILAWAGLDDDGAKRGRSDLPLAMYSFLKRLLAVDPSERPTTGEILASLRSNTELSEESERHSPVDERYPHLAHSRISTVDSPRPHDRRHSSYQHGHGNKSALSSVDLQPDISIARSPSPLKKDLASEDERETLDRRPSTAIIRARKPHFRPVSIQNQELHRAGTPLALQAPPNSDIIRLLIPHFSIPLTPLLYVVTKLTIFTIKFLSLSYPCYPLPLQSKIAVPLILLAAFDLMVINADRMKTVQVSLGLLGVHILIVTGLGRLGMICEGWNAVDY